MSVTWGQDTGVVQHRRPGGPAAGASRAMTESVAALLALAAYVMTFAFAGNGCWLDVAAAVGISAIVGHCIMLAARRSISRRALPGSDEADSGLPFQLCARGALAAAAVLAGAAGLNVLLYTMTGIETLGARVVALLFIPLHLCLIVIADVTAGIAIASAADARSLGRSSALRAWLLWFNAPALFTFTALRWSGVI